MKKLFALLALFALTAWAEPTFQQIEGLIESRQYAAAEQGLETIIQNHPQSAKAFYAMSQAQAGLGHLDKAQFALNKARGLDPELKFASSSNIESLQTAITPQVAKIEPISESHFWRNLIMILSLSAIGIFVYTVWTNKQKEDDAREKAEREATELREAERKRQHMEMLAKQDIERKAELAAEAALKAHKNYGHERFDPSNPDKLKTAKRMKEEADEKQLREAQARADAAEASARMYRTSAQAVAPTHTTVVNNSGNDLITGMMIGNMMSGSHHDHHDTTIIRETVREVPVTRDSSWDTPAPAPVKSTWDDTPAPSRSSSWDDSSSSSSSSWSSSSSDSSSSWGSSDSGSSWD